MFWGIRAFYDRDFGDKIEGTYTNEFLTMEQVINNPTTIIPLVMTFILLQIVIFVKSKHTRYWIGFIIAVGLSVILWGGLNGKPMTLFILATLFHALLGFLHLRLLPYMLALSEVSLAEKLQRKTLKSLGESFEEKDKNTSWGFVYTYIPTPIGTVLFFGFSYIAIKYYDFFEVYKIWFGFSFMAFALPMLFRKTIEGFLEIPELHYKGEHIRPNDPVPEIIPKGESTSLNIQLKEKPSDKTPITFKPENNMPINHYTLGALFRELLWHKNEHDGKVEYESNEWEWIFFDKKSKRALDPALTLLENELKQGNTVLAKRQKIK